jgi:hypothetical protein
MYAGGAGHWPHRVAGVPVQEREFPICQLCRSSGNSGPG